MHWHAERTLGRDCGRLSDRRIVNVIQRALFNGREARSLAPLLTHIFPSGKANLQSLLNADPLSIDRSNRAQTTMAKRRPDYNLNPNNWDDELEPDDVGEYQQANEDQMKNRVIRRAKRRLPRDQPDTGAPTKAATSVFSGFSFDKLGASNSGAGAANAAASKPLFSFGTAAAAPFSFSSNSTATMSSAANSVTSAATAAAKGEKSQQYKCKLKSLNKAVLDSIQGYVDGASLCILTPIFKDYEKYVKELDEDESKPATETASGAATNTAPSDLDRFKFSLAPAKATEPTASSSSVAAVASAPTAINVTPSFSFGKPAAVAPATAASSSALSGFSFATAVKQAKETTANGAQADGGDDEDDQPPKVEFVPVVEDDNIYSKRCKVFVKDDASFKDRGTGTLYMKRVKDDKVQLIVRADTNLGNILLNIIVSEAIPATRNKNNLILVCIPTPEAEQKARQVLVRVKTEDDAVELLDEYQKHQK